MKVAKQWRRFLLTFLLIVSMLMPASWAADAGELSAITLSLVNYDAETMGTFASAVTYAISPSKQYEAIPGGVIDLSALWGKKLTFVVAGKTKTLTLTARPSAPNVRLDSTKEVLTGFTANASYEISWDNNTWQSYTAPKSAAYDIAAQIPAYGASDKVVYVRLASTAAKPRSSTKEILIPARAKTPAASGFTINYEKKSLVLPDKIYAVSIDGGGTWTNASTSFSLNTAFTKGADSILVRVRATTSVMASLPLTLSFLEEGDAPADIALDPKTENLTGLVKSTGKLQYSRNGGSSWTLASADSVNLTSAITAIKAGQTLEIHVRTPAAGSVPASRAVVFVVSARADAPTCYIDTQHNQVAGLNDTMEARFATSGDFNPVPDGADSMDLPATFSVVQVRYRGSQTGNNITPASKTQAVTLPKKLTAPSVSYDAVNVAIKGVEAGMEYQILASAKDVPGTAWTMVEEEALENALLPVPEEAYGQFLVFRRTGNAVQLASPPSRVLTIPGKQGDLPQNIVFVKKTEVIVGITKEMEYKLDGAKSWTAGTGKDVSVSSFLNASTSDDTVVWVRLKAVSKPATAAGEPLGVIIRQRPETEAVFLGAGEVLTGFAEDKTAEDYSYSTSSTSGWKAIDDEAVRKLIPAYGKNAKAKTIYVRLNPTDDSVAGTVASVTLEPRADAPAPEIDYAGEKIIKLTETMEYKWKDQTEYTAVTAEEAENGLPIPAERALYGSDAITIRIQSTDEKPASMDKTMTIARPVPPSVSADFTNMVYKNASETMAYRLWDADTEEWGPWTTVVLNEDELFPIADGHMNRILQWRTCADEKKLSSQHKIVELPDWKETPDDLVTFTLLTESVKGSAGAQYRVGEDGEWQTLSDAKAVSIASALTGENVTLYYRVGPTATAPASRPAKTMALTGRAPAPAAAFDDMTAIVTGVDNTMEYSYNQTTWKTFTQTTFEPDLEEEPGKLYVRVKATETAIASLTQTIELPAGSEKPSLESLANVINYNDGGKITLTLPATLDYKIGGDASFTQGAAGIDITSRQKTDADVIIWVRTGAAGGHPFSPAVAITLLKPLAAPAITVNYTAETLGGVTSNMEYKVNNGAYQAVTGTTVSIADSYGSEVKVRLKATATTPASLDFTIQLAAVPSAPTGISYNWSTGYIEGLLVGQHEYSFNGLYWYTVTNTTLNANIYRSPLNVVLFYVRTKPTLQAPASRWTVIELPVL